MGSGIKKAGGGSGRAKAAKGRKAGKRHGKRKGRARRQSKKQVRAKRKRRAAAKPTPPFEGGGRPADDHALATPAAGPDDVAEGEPANEPGRQQSGEDANDPAASGQSPFFRDCQTIISELSASRDEPLELEARRNLVRRAILALEEAPAGRELLVRQCAWMLEEADPEAYRDLLHRFQISGWLFQYANSVEGGDAKRRYYLGLLRPLLAREWGVRSAADHIELDSAIALLHRVLQGLAYGDRAADDGLARLLGPIDRAMHRFGRIRAELESKATTVDLEEEPVRSRGGDGDAGHARAAASPPSPGLIPWQARSGSLARGAGCLELTFETLLARSLFDLPAPAATVLRWRSADGEAVAALRVRLDRSAASPSLRLQYRYRSAAGEADADQQVGLQPVTGRNAGPMICPRCRRLARQLICPPGSSGFGCDQCVRR
ncbi:hypothetical protein ACERK3_11525 [Phycisphaerales bacterium AB-hyl4]|uniref:Uncharacterized protein n=1 Tax=Natronomicrosphaera hydrolytica TaxID=3242702 RepID=A0ABV4U7Y3_9BACT